MGRSTTSSRKNHTTKIYYFRWEDEYYAAYKKNSGLLHLNEKNMSEKNIVKASSPEKFVNAITKSADKLIGKRN